MDLFYLGCTLVLLALTVAAAAGLQRLDAAGTDR